jgi:hypothetical protein
LETSGFEQGYNLSYQISNAHYFGETKALYIPGALEDLAKFAGETPITQLMLGGAIMMEISIVMIFLSRILKYKANRWANIIVGLMTILFVVSGGSPYPHYIFIATIEVLCLLLIIGIAWKWRNTEG